MLSGAQNEAMIFSMVALCHEEIIKPIAVKCEISSFRMEKELGEGIVPVRGPSLRQSQSDTSVLSPASSRDGPMRIEASWNEVIFFLNIQ